MAKSLVSRIATLTVVVVLVAVVGYAFFPYAASTKVTDLTNDQTAYIYGMVKTRQAFGNESIFSVNDTSGTVYVLWNGTVPSIGENVLVHGTYREGSLFHLSFGIFVATSVTPWPI